MGVLILQWPNSHIVLYKFQKQLWTVTKSIKFDDVKYIVYSFVLPEEYDFLCSMTNTTIFMDVNNIHVLLKIQHMKAFYSSLLKEIIIIICFRTKVTMEEQKEILLGALLNGDINRDEYAKELKSIEDIMLVSICVCWMHYNE